MDDIELVFNGEIFRISEDIGPDGKISYHFSWLNGPADGSYGFTVSRFGVGSGSTPAEPTPQMTNEQLISEVQGFITAFYESGGIGEQDFPHRTPAQPRNKNGS
ncbi:hypothetical protein N2K95_01395 [Arthrobacter zhaoxinii]|uniref:Uncharacterized protein n=1 Tax=Arthrobacter zhaoxinii TaxID=2964616 RepID=A0ABY5YTH9_9MICC|nr:hypothetical protein [Arthrobacter zhaoxinii]UWX97378.1 hypothetical protein N2K95_01395 [Arthrobacter zhaoxinii]